MKAPLFNWLEDRATGVLLHPTSLPGNQGVGTLDISARRFVDFLKSANIRYWQICPIGHTGFGDSPYQCFSAFAGNPYLIDISQLAGGGLLTQADILPLQDFPDEHVDYGKLYLRKWPVLRLAFRNFRKRNLAYLPNFGLYEDFLNNEKAWLDPYATFMALKDIHNGAPWYQWPKVLRDYQSAMKQTKVMAQIQDSIDAYKFFQYVFSGQWKLLKHYANKQDVEIIGDIPIYVAYDSADVWANPELFQIYKNGKLKAVAGVPPDYFSAMGQLWGNPLYDWKQHEATGYKWWLKRLESSFSFCDVLRIDHFRGFESYWQVPGNARDARKGKWIPGPGLPFFEKIKSTLPQAKIIAEDLGEITPAVHKLREATGLPGMIILHFAFSDDPKNTYLPHNHTVNSVVYPGTHDNDTSIGWYTGLKPNIQHQIRRYFRINGDAIGWDLIRASYESVSKLAVFPLQDLLNLDSEARMNLPGTSQGNWQWRCTRDQLEDLHLHSADYLKELAWLYGR